MAERAERNGQKEVSAGKGMFGLSGVFGVLGNATAMLVVVVMFWQLQGDVREQAREERTLFRDELRRMAAKSEREWQALHSQQQIIAGLQGSVNDLAAMVKSLADEVRKIKREGRP
jgi:hypothetical protein